MRIWLVCAPQVAPSPPYPPRVGRLCRRARRPTTHSVAFAHLSFICCILSCLAVCLVVRRTSTRNIHPAVPVVQRASSCSACASYRHQHHRHHHHIHHHIAAYPLCCSAACSEKPTTTIHTYLLSLAHSLSLSDCSLVVIIVVEEGKACVVGLVVWLTQLVWVLHVDTHTHTIAHRTKRAPRDSTTTSRDSLRPSLYIQRRRCRSVMSFRSADKHT